MSAGVVVLVATFRRARGLERLLRSLAAQEGVELRVVVVNNDPSDGEVEGVVEGAREAGLSVRLEVEGERGISAARNRCVAVGFEEAEAMERSGVAAGNGGRWFAFIDDDEEAPAGWLRAMTRVGEACGADGVTGANDHRYEEEPPGWLVEAGMFGRRRLATGTAMPWAFTNNVLVRVEAMRAFADGEARLGREVFDARLGRSGGSDKHLFMRWVKAGYSLVWCDDEAPIEWNPAERMEAAWIVRRKGRQGRTYSYITCDVHPGWLTVVAQVLRGGVSVVQGSLMWVWSVVGGEAMRVRARARFAWGWGIWAGLLGRLTRGYGG